MQKLNKAITIILIGFTGFTHLQADSSNNNNSFGVQEFYYQKGYTEASSKFYKKGYEDAIRDIKKKLLAFKKRHDAIEASKYLSVTGKISYPEVVKYRDEAGNYRVKIIPPKVEKEFTVYDLVKIPDAPEEIEDKTIKSFKKKMEKHDDSFYSQKETEGSAKTGIIKNINSINKEVVLSVKKNRKTKQLLDAADISYAEGSNNYKIYFKSPFEKEVFCNGAGSRICH